MYAKTSPSPSERAVKALQRRIEAIRRQEGEQRAMEVAVGALLLIDRAIGRRPAKEPDATQP
jgi:hypothetical protein